MIDYLVTALFISAFAFVTLKLFVFPALRQNPPDPNVTIDTIKPHPIVADKITAHKITAHTVTAQQIAADKITAHTVPAHQIADYAHRNDQQGDTK